VWVIRVRQTDEDDCLATAVACVLEVDRDTLPNCKPTVFPEDLNGAWNDWAFENGYFLTITDYDPGVMCVAGVCVPGPHPARYGGKYDDKKLLHAVVWDNGLVYDPGGYTPGLYDEVCYYLKVEEYDYAR
jgi:hypothetical protein